jgi:hypothetical protein
MRKVSDDKQLLQSVKQLWMKFLTIENYQIIYCLEKKMCLYVGESYKII